MTFQVEFVELPEEESEANESDNLVISHSESEDHGQQGGGGEGLLEDSKVTKTFTLWRKVKVLKVLAKGEHGVICRPASACSDKTPDKNFN